MKYFLWIIILVLITAGVTHELTSHANTSQTPAQTPTASDNPTVDVKPNTTVQVTNVSVAKYYDGENGYSLSIPSGNTSTCTWTYAGGSADVPYTQTTYANSASEKHTLEPEGGVDSYYSFKVTCVDDFGNRYVGVFPTQSQ